MNKQVDKPTQYQKGYCEFYKLKFLVTPDVLIPRPETELLVDEVLAYAKRSKHPEERTSDEGSHKLTILDLGTGAGNIIISIAKNLSSLTRGPLVRLIATDISSKALKVAKKNARLHGVKNRIKFISGNLLSNVILKPKVEESLAHASSPRVEAGHIRDGSFTSVQDDIEGIDVIVTNLPYIPTSRIPYLDESVKDFEPHIALDGGEDGFDLYRKLFQQIVDKKLRPKLLIGEIDYTHGETAIYEANKYFPGYKVEVKTDLTHKQRILKIELTD